MNNEHVSKEGFNKFVKIIFKILLIHTIKNVIFSIVGKSSQIKLRSFSFLINLKCVKSAYTSRAKCL